MKRNKRFFTLPEVTMAIAILGIGLVSILGVFPVAVKSGLQAVKMSEAIHKARAITSLYQVFATKAATINPIPPFNIELDSDAEYFAFGESDNLVGTGCTFIIPPLALTRTGSTILDANGMPIPGMKTIIPYFLNGKFQMDRVFLTVNDEFDTYFYLIRHK